ncbi:hypothetical protein MetfoDRAFT_1408 [Methanotorris formicicus Mc-S-70]|uniref:Uncharacterized protein n=1 Tax=Methanotorris formicicus Mc-S-70 TaxID=647171 RepID=H1L034_9EURY|nr:hypothetical protein MetfoDRAFT_1408 [Methanotorris formicicus Mc-S-70]
MKQDKNDKIEIKNKSSKKRNGYWKSYDLRYKKYDLKTTYTFILSIINKLNPPSNEGRKVVELHLYLIMNIW